MTKTQEALRIELEELKNEVYEMRSMYDKKLSIESNRVDRIVQVLLNNLPKEQLDRGITFSGFDCCDKYRSWISWDGRTLRDFLTYIIDP